MNFLYWTNLIFSSENPHVVIQIEPSTTSSFVVTFNENNAEPSGLQHKYNGQFYPSATYINEAASKSSAKKRCNKTSSVKEKEIEMN